MPKIEPGPPEYCNILVVSDWEIVIPLNSTVSIVLSCFTLYKVTNLLESEEFETIRFTAEDLESIVLGLEDYEYDFTTEECAVEKSIQLYQEIKYICEALEESITDLEILSELGYIRASVYLIRSLFV